MNTVVRGILASQGIENVSQLMERAGRAAASAPGTQRAGAIAHRPGRRPITLEFSAQLQGQYPGTTYGIGTNSNDTPIGDAFGTGVSINPCTGELLTSALGAFVSAKLQVGAIYYFREDAKGCPQIPWQQFQPPTVSVAPGGGAFGFNRLGGISVASRGRWAFFSLPGTPDDLDADQFLEKNNLGEVIVFRRVRDPPRDGDDGAGSDEDSERDEGKKKKTKKKKKEEEEEEEEEEKKEREKEAAHDRCFPWRLFQKIPNPNPSLGGPNPEFGLNLAYAGGRWLLVGGGRLLASFIYRFSRKQRAWTLANVLRPAAQATVVPGNLVVALSRDTAFVGPPQIFEPPFVPGAVAVYRRANERTWAATFDPSTPDQTLVPLDPVISPDIGTDLFGGIMAADGRRALISAPVDSQAGFAAGAVYVFVRDRSSGLWTQRQKLLPPPNADPSTGPFLFGFAVALRGILAVVGNPFGAPKGVIGEGDAVVYNRVSRRPEVWEAVQIIEDPNPSYSNAEACGGGLLVLGTSFGGGGSSLTNTRYALGNGNATPNFAVSPPPPVPVTPGRLLVFNVRGDPRDRHHGCTDGERTRDPCHRGHRCGNSGVSIRFLLGR